MPNKPDEPASPEFEKITPAKIEISTRATAHAEPDSTPPSTHAKNHRLGIWLVIMAVLGVAVFWLLPQVVQKPEVVKGPTANPVIAPSGAASGSSPWQEAQRSRERKEAQDILSEFLDQQFLLEEKRVDLWGMADFDVAKQMAQSGDAAYREAAYVDATQHYVAGVAVLADLLVRADNVVSDYLAIAAAALEAVDAEAARTAFELVLEVDPLNSEAARGYARAETLDEVMAMFGEALSAEAINELDEALELLNGALKIDPDLVPAQRSRSQVLAKIGQREFSQAMSRGYAALESGRYSEANRDFGAALKRKPNSAEARDGLSQVSHQLTRNKIAALKQAALEFEAQEQWQAATDKFQAVLALDSSVVFAQEGAARASTRARLNQLLVEAIAQPARLSDSAVASEAQQLLRVAATVERPGPLLQQQVVTLQEHLETASKPVNITLSSDNLTDVTLYRVGHLGNFLSHELSLKPGVYALVGKRAGFRDVRKEFIVAHGRLHDPVAIQCTEKI